MKNFETAIYQRIKDMDEVEAKKTLAVIFSKSMNVGRNDFTKEECFNDIEEIYNKFVIEDLYKKSL